MPGPLHILCEQLNKQKGRRYRLVSLAPANVVEKKVRGYKFLRKEDPEVKGTILEEHVRADGLVAVANLGLARISEEDAQKHDAEIQARRDRKLRMVKRGFKRKEEEIKRQMGPHHKDFKIIMKEE